MLLDPHQRSSSTKTFKNRVPGVQLLQAPTKIAVDRIQRELDAN